MGPERLVRRRTDRVCEGGSPASRHILTRSINVFPVCVQRGTPRKLVATFDSEEQLLAYVGWATLKKNADGTSKFEQGSAPVGIPIVGIVAEAAVGGGSQRSRSQPLSEYALSESPPRLYGICVQHLHGRLDSNRRCVG